MQASSQCRRKLIWRRPSPEDWRMYLLLLVFGGLVGAAGVVLGLSGLSLRDGTFDAAILTPGIVAAAGGLLLIGLGAGLRTLQRIERALASRPIAESAKTAETVETPRE